MKKLLCQRGHCGEHRCTKRRFRLRIQKWVSPVADGGPNAAFGARLKNVAEQAAADLNAKAGINGQEDSFVFGDAMRPIPSRGRVGGQQDVGEGRQVRSSALNSGVTNCPPPRFYQENACT